MGTTLSKGETLALRPASGTRSIGIAVRQRSATAISEIDASMDLSALMVDSVGRVLSDDHFVFYNAPRSPEGSVTLSYQTSAAGEQSSELLLNLSEVPDGCDGIAIVVSNDDAAPGAAALRVRQTPAGQTLATLALEERQAGDGTAILAAAVFRDRENWQFRAVGDVYGGGLGEVASALGVNIS